jgi:hypothetical protein
MAEKEMTKKQLAAACRRVDAEEAAKDRQEIDRLVRAMRSRRFKFYAWELDEVKRLVHGAYGRMALR